MADSQFFKEYYRTLSFEERAEKFTAAAADDILIEGIFPDGCDRPVGYCVSTVEEGRGEIDSLYLEEPYRDNGYGKQLVERGLHWLRSKGCTTIRVAVAAGHESVFGFYEKLGFYPKMTVLQWKEAKTNTETHRTKKPISRRRN
jgi:ribosomal protein S18 acetylase RimI-like enzyme